MAVETSLRRLQILQRDLVAFTQDRLPHFDRLIVQLDASAEDLKKLLERKRKSEASRSKLAPTNDSQSSTVKIDGVEYSIHPQFRESAIRVADELDLDEIEAAKLCIESQIPGDHAADSLTLRALIRFHQQRQALLDSVRILLQVSLDSDGDESPLSGVAKALIQGVGATQSEGSAYWRSCLEGLGDVEAFLKKVSQYKDKIIMTGQKLSGEMGEAVAAQRLLLTQQHESLAAILCYMIRGSYVQPQDYRSLLSKASAFEGDADIATHYLPILISGAAYFASDHSTSSDAARDLHTLFAAGPGQLQWKISSFGAAAKVLWLAEYNARFSVGSIDVGQSETERARGEEARSKLFFDSLKDKAFHFILTASSFLRPIVWHDPAKRGIVDWLVEDVVSPSPDAPRSSEEFATLVMRELQIFADAFVTNMPDTLRQLKAEEDEKRRNLLLQSANGVARSEMDLERFMVIMAYAYQGDAEAARDFWADRESNQYGFLRWVSQRLPTPRVAAFCTLLKAIASDDHSANNAHRFLLEDVTMTSGKLRKAYSVSWSQIFSEVELFASDVKDKSAAAAQAVPVGQEQAAAEQNFEEPETGIMLISYLGLAAHVARTSPEARNWLLKDQPFHIGEVMCQLIRTVRLNSLRACCLDMLAALLTEKVLEVRNGLWVLLDTWISSGGSDGLQGQRPTTQTSSPARQYLQLFAASSEAASAFVQLLNGLVSPIEEASDKTVDALPFPENLGAPVRHAGIETYVDFVMDAVFARSTARMTAEGNVTTLHALRFECLQFAFQCLTTFNEDLVLLANTTNVAVESAMETKSLATYARLHPFARVMERLFEKGVVASLIATLQQPLDTLDDAEPGSPLVQATLKGIQVLNLAWKLQPTHLDIVRPIVLSHASSRTQPAVGATLGSIDELLLSNLDVVTYIADLTGCKHVEICLESLTLLQRIASSRKLCESVDVGAARSRRSNRIISVLSPLATALTLQLRQDFVLDEWDLELGEMPLKLVKAKAVLDLLNASLDSSSNRPSVAHCLLGFNCFERVVDVLPGSVFDENNSLFHEIAACCVTLPTVATAGNTSWLLSVKRGCLDVILKLVVSPMTAHIVQPQLRAMDFLAALSHAELPASTSPLWDGQVINEPTALLNSSALAIRDFLHVREAFFEFAAASLRSAGEHNSFSVQEKIVSTLLGTIEHPDGEQVPTMSVFEMFDFFDLETMPASEANCRFLADVDLSSCTKDDPETLISFDLKTAEDLLHLHKKELKDKGSIRDPAEFEAIDYEIQAILASLLSQNNWTAVQSARLAALEAWTDLMSLMVTKGGLEQNDVIALSLQGLLVVLPKFEKSLADNLDSAGMLAKLTLTFTHAISPASHDPSQQTVNVAVERLLNTFRVCLKVITDSSTDLALRDVCYRTGCAVLASVSNAPSSSRASASASTRQLLQLVQNCGERLLIVVTEDAFSGRGVTRISALLFQDALIGLFQSLKAKSSILRALMKLNFVPVLIDSSIGSVAAAFSSEDELTAVLAFIHTSLALLLRLCQTPEGTQLVLNSGLFQAVDDSHLFSTDPDLGMDVDNPQALTEFYSILADVLRIVTAAVVSKGPAPGKAFLQKYRSTVQAIFKQASRGIAINVADELGRLLLATDFLEVRSRMECCDPRSNLLTYLQEDQSATSRILQNGFS
jgi:nuclear pore complex protein Nup205